MTSISKALKSMNPKRNVQKKGVSGTIPSKNGFANGKVLLYYWENSFFA